MSDGQYRKASRPFAEYGLAGDSKTLVELNDIKIGSFQGPPCLSESGLTQNVSRIDWLSL